jgi:23S rRNA pseudouridine2605 synthase
VNRLIRVAYGPFELGELDDAEVAEVPTEELRAALGPDLAAQASADFESPLEHEVPSAPTRHSGARPHRREKQRDGAKPPLDSGARAGTRDRNDRRKKQRRDRTGGPRPKYPRPKS